MRLGVGLVIKNGDEFIEKWLESADRIADVIFVVDNDGTTLSTAMLTSHPKVKYYKLQKGLERNMSRDYQQLLNMAREENVDWLWNIDVDEIVPFFDKREMTQMLVNSRSESIGFPLFEMRDDDKHYVRVKEADGAYKDARGVHKCFKVLSHLEYNLKDRHGRSIPHNCKVDILANIPIQHFGHMTKKLRDEKRKFYKNESNNNQNFSDASENFAEWMKEEPKEIVKWKQVKEVLTVWQMH